MEGYITRDGSTLQKKTYYKEYSTDSPTWWFIQKNNKTIDGSCDNYYSTCKMFIGDLGLIEKSSKYKTKVKKELEKEAKKQSEQKLKEATKDL